MMKKIKHWIQAAKRMITANNERYQLVTVGTHFQKSMVHIKNKALFLKCTFSEAMADHSIIDRLSPIDACCLGGYYGRALPAAREGRTTLKAAKNMISTV